MGLDAFGRMVRDIRLVRAMLLYAIFDICELADFEIEGRIVLVDKRSGKVWR